MALAFANTPVVPSAAPANAPVVLPAAPVNALPVAVAATPPTPPRTAYANEDPNDDLIVGPPAARDDCDALLKAEGIRYTIARLPVHRHKSILCGAEQVVVYARSAAGISYEPRPVVTCTMALALSRFDAAVQEEAKRALGKRIVRIRQLGTYACREMKAYPGWVSEHSYANAIDLETFTLEGGAQVSVLRHFEKLAAPAKAEGRFLGVLSQRAYDEGIFSTVLTPFFDALHRNHFHVDLARYRTDGTRAP